MRLRDLVNSALEILAQRVEFWRRHKYWCREVRNLAPKRYADIWHRRAGEYRAGYQVVSLEASKLRDEKLQISAIESKLARRNRALKRYADIWHRRADGYRAAYETASLEASQLRDEKLQISAIESKLAKRNRALKRYADIWHRRADGYRAAYETASLEASQLRDEKKRRSADEANLVKRNRALKRYADIWHRRADGYHSAYETASNESAKARDERDRILKSLSMSNSLKKAIPPGLQGRQLCFLHIGKTAGTSVQHALLEIFQAAPIFHGSLPEFDTVTASELAINDLVLGHFMFQHLEKMRRDRFTFTFLRDPIERVISNYHFLRTDSPVSGFSKIAIEAAKAMPLRDFLLCEDPHVRMISENFQAKAIAYDIRPEYQRSIYDLLQQSQRNLSAFDFVGVTDLFTSSLSLLSKLLDVDIPVRTLNRNEARTRIARPSVEELEIIANLNAVDLRLYREAVSLLRNKL